MKNTNEGFIGTWGEGLYFFKLNGPDEKPSLTQIQGKLRTI